MLFPKDIDNGRFTLASAQKISILNPGKFLVRSGDILLSSRGKFVAVVASEEENGCIASSLFLRIAINNSSKILPEYLCGYLNSSEGQKSLCSIAGTSTTHAITKNDLENVQIPIPPIEKQKILGQLYVELNNTKRIIAKKIDLTNKLINSQFKK